MKHLMLSAGGPGLEVIQSNGRTDEKLTMPLGLAQKKSMAKARSSSRKTLHWDPEQRRAWWEELHYGKSRQMPYASLSFALHCMCCKSGLVQLVVQWNSCLRLLWAKQLEGTPQLGWLRIHNYHHTRFRNQLAELQDRSGWSQVTHMR